MEVFMARRYRIRRAMIFTALSNLLFIAICLIFFRMYWSSFTPDQWTAIGTISLAATTVLLYLTAMWQLFMIRKEAQKNRTLDICNRYDNDPIFDAATETLDKAKKNGDLAANPAKYRKAVITILNYLDSIAIGIEQGLYITSLAKDHLNEILQAHVAEYLHDTKFARDAGYNVDYFKRLRKLADDWNQATTNYKE